MPATPARATTANHPDHEMRSMRTPLMPLCAVSGRMLDKPSTSLRRSRRGSNSMVRPVEETACNLPAMRVLVTGGGGFLGSHLVERLQRDGHDVVAARRRDWDLTSMDAARRLFESAAPELVFHLAAEVGGIGANRANPGRYWYANLMMGAHVLEQARLQRTPKLVVAGTVCAYPKHTPVPFREDELWTGYPEETNAPYGVAKKTILVGAQSYREQYGMNAIFLLPTNLYGP